LELTLFFVCSIGGGIAVRRFAITPVDTLMKEWMRQLRGGVSLRTIIDDALVRMRTADDEDRYQLALHLHHLLGMAGRDGEALQIMNDMIGRYPNDVRFPISKVIQYLYFTKDLEEALKSIELALLRAYHTGLFRREALGVKARILLQLGRGEELSDVLDEIMSLRMIKDTPDIGRERDFVDRAPPGMIRADVLARYNKFRPKRPGDTDKDVPPVFEPPDDAE
jgi:hypothetical protein